MLKSLEIHNFVIVDSIRLDFEPGLNIITGETGAGKSILINAISQLCGDRSSTDLIRSTQKKAMIEARLSNSWELLKDLAVIGELNIDKTDQEIIIRKEIYANGNSRVFINDSPATLNVLSQIAEPLFDLHGQHQHQRLLHPQNHIIYLDEFAGTDILINRFSKCWHDYNQAAKQIKELRSKQAEALQQQDLIRFQIKELSDAQLRSGELEELRDEKKRMDNIENLSALSESVNTGLYTGEVNAGDLLARAETELKRLAELDGQFAAMREAVQFARESVEEVGRFVDRYQNELSFDAERMEFLNERINRLEFFLKKYQADNIDMLLKRLAELQSQIDHIDRFEELLSQAQRVLIRLRDELLEIGQQLGDKRRRAAKEFSKLIADHLAEVGLNHARFDVQIEYREAKDQEFELDGQAIQPDENGFDVVTFCIEANPGEPARPIHKAASGGEISRIMLAIKSALAEMDQVPTMVFDEIDSGISGKVAGTVGQKLYRLAGSHQLICVTHLPQIAAYGNKHFRVGKRIENGRTYVEIVPLAGEDRVQEIAALLAGAQVSDAALRNARQLLEESAFHK